MKLEVVVIPVSIVERAKNFLKSGWRLKRDTSGIVQAGHPALRVPVQFGGGRNTAARRDRPKVCG